MNKEIIVPENYEELDGSNEIAKLNKNDEPITKEFDIEELLEMKKKLSSSEVPLVSEIKDETFAKDNIDVIVSEENIVNEEMDVEAKPEDSNEPLLEDIKDEEIIVNTTVSEHVETVKEIDREPEIINSGDTVINTNINKIDTTPRIIDNDKPQEKLELPPWDLEPPFDTVDRGEL